MLDVAFVRSVEPHALLGSIDTAPALALDGVHAVFTAADLAEVASFPDFVPGNQPVKQRPLAEDRVRYVGSPYAAVVADDRYVAEDAAALVAMSTDYEALQTVASIDQALTDGAPKLYGEWPSNRVLDFPTELVEVRRAIEQADHTFTETYTSQRQTGLPLETRGVVADVRDGQLTVWSSTQSPHVVRTTLALVLGIPEPRVRVIAPAIGGGFGTKAHVYPEDVVIAWIAWKLERPVRWIEDRLENLTSAPHARDQRHDVQVGYDDDGTIRAIRCHTTGDVGSGEIFFPGTAPTLVTGGCITGAYDFQQMEISNTCAVTNKTPSGSYRGFGVPEGIFVMERIIDRVARLTGTGRVELRCRMILQEQQLPYTMFSGGRLESGSHAKAFDRAVELIGPKLDAARVKYAEDADVRVGVGFANYVEPTTPTYHVTTGHWAGYDSATVRIDPDGAARVSLGITAIGQGTETVAAQLTAEALGIDPDDVTVVLGDTERCPYGLGSWGSRSAMVMAGSIVAAADRLLAKARDVAAHMLEASADDLVLADGEFQVAGSRGRSVGWAEVATAAWVRTVDLPAGTEPGLESSAFFEPLELEHALDGTGRINAASGWSNGAHAGVVSVRVSTGEVTIEDYVVVHDCGTMLNPMIIEGQIHGGVAQGIAGAMYEHLQYDPEGAWPQFGSLVEYVVPSSSEVPHLTVDHFESPSPHRPLGAKGCGEGGTIGPPAVIAGAVSDALADLGVDLTETPVSPASVRAAVHVS